MDRNSPEFILYMSQLGIASQEATDSLMHSMKQRLKAEGKTVYMGTPVDLDKIYCCTKCNNK